MSDPFIGEVRIFASSYVPEGWHLCDGSTLDVRAYQALYAVIGNTYGGSPNVNFKVPNLLGMAVSAPGLAPTGGAFNKQLGHAYGAPAVTLSQSNLPPHSHVIQRQTNNFKYAGKTAAPDNKSNLGGMRDATTNVAIFSTASAPNTTLLGTTIGNSGSSTPAAHNNLQPYQVFYWGIALDGIFPVWQ
ncbi:MAG: tail fiber protein [Asticcacaulis sp.]|uniref:phage tail protein n=1 Tax=Asticcacaulis sp. TaxID=1872648 RepID=UPI0025C28265|nr:tail fiber protein [Asticcacaulis sp.]MCA1935019.1 tail fiber protein [Asticcacaulis sp.]